MTKKLSEIGTPFWFCYFHYADKTEIAPHEIRFTPAERQDLVRQVFEYAWQEGQCHPNLGVEAELGKFLEDNGL